ncbi:o-succinylbenzoate synthase [Kribbella antibiotica]|uniref:o-succinylbenzoate synthase n=1 Tax=Kribbella antibiotica TaxID=190195 RepID=A0A4R4YRY6_9ACTN|nr:o-succinylbenzoate synthase [Kribbella antibiotica]TDD47963.1 o-succinylbenzoate synthase [Kribbella antibiotica]
MKIVAARLHRVRLPLVHEFRTSSHGKSMLDHILVELIDASGAVGWGEIASPSDPYYAPETVESCWHIAERYLVPAILGKDWNRPEDLAQLWAKVRGNQFAKSGFDTAGWVLWATTAGVPLADALGGTRTEVVAGVSLGIEPSIDALLTEVERHLAAGYPRVKLKIAPGWDVEPVRAVRAAHPDLDLHVDANGIYTEAQSDQLKALDEFNLTMIEQPFAPRDLLAHANLQREIATPICLDESVETVEDLETALSLKALRVLNIKVSRMGGLTPARAAHDRAHSAGIPVWCGGMHEFGIGRAANVALSSLQGFSLPSDVSASAKYYTQDVITPPVTATQGAVRVPTAAGLGHEVDTAFIAQNAVATIELTS